MTNVHKTQKKKGMSVRFADEEGKAMETLYDKEHGDCTSWCKRVLVLLLLPETKSFEYVRVEYHVAVDNQQCNDNDDEFLYYATRTRISQLLRELPSMASDPKVARGRFQRLLRADCMSGDDDEGTYADNDDDDANNKDGSVMMRGTAANAYTELINALSIQSYNFPDDAVLVAVPEGCTSQGIMESAKHVLKNKTLLRAVKRKRWWGRSVLKPTYAV